VDVPHPTLLTIIEPKRELQHCHHECASGCALHENVNQPNICRTFQCPYIRGEDVHKPDSFQWLLEELGGNMGNFIPAISTQVPVTEAQALIASSRSLPAFILINGQWIETILPLDKEPDGSWQTAATDEWAKLYSDHGAILPLEKEEVVEIVV